MMKMIKRRRTRFVVQLTTLVAFVVVVGAAAVGSFVSQAIKIYYIPDDVVVSIYLICLLALWQLVAWMSPKRR